VPPNGKVQATETDFALHSLGWKAFQQLCATILAEIWGQTIQSFLDGGDAGRDGAFHGSWTPQKHETFTGSFTVQCKFTSKPSQSLQFADLKDELVKVQKLAAQGLCENYFVFTNKGVRAPVDAEIRAAFENIPGVEQCLVIGYTRICEMIRESPRLRMLVPRIYGLGDLSTIIDERSLAQSKEILSALGDDLQKFVITDAYRRSAKALVDHGFVLLLGEPACGKSAIATALAMGALDEWGCSAFKIRDAADFVQHSNPHDAKQFFWVDDVFGATQLDHQSVVEWNRALPHLSAAIRRGAKVVFTSRDYIYRNARYFLKESAMPLLASNQVVIKVEQISSQERQLILYNHIRLGTQSREFKSSIKPYLPAVASNPHFKPEIARRLGNPAFTTQLKIRAADLRSFVERPVPFLQEVIQTLDRPSRSAIALVFMRNGSVESPVSLSSEEVEALSSLGGVKAEVITALGALEGSLLISVIEGGRTWWRFKHPTIRDAFADIVWRDRELMDIYLRGTPLLRMLSEITCGDVKLAGAKLVVPPDRFGLVRQRIEAGLLAARDSRSSIVAFLSRRCTAGFISEFFSANPAFQGSLGVGAYLYAVSDVALIATLHSFGLLCEEKRLQYVAEIRDVVLETPDSGFTRSDIKNMFTPEEFSALLADVRKLLLSGLDDVLSHWQDNEPDGSKCEDYYSELISALDEMGSLFPEDDYVGTSVLRAQEHINQRIQDAAASQADFERDEDAFGFAGRGIEQISGRSTFDDVDD
jgi:hypothetical protein